MKKTVIYIHGKGGGADEAIRFKPLFPDADVIGFDYKANTPWDAASEFRDYAKKIYNKSGAFTVIANSIGAFSLCTRYLTTP